MSKVFKPNQKVFTVNGKTNTVDEWTYLGEFKAKDEKLCCLVDDKHRRMFIPKRCVFETIDKANAVINMSKKFN